jgi:segregation and condensation protein B
VAAELKAVVEALLFVADEPLSLRRLAAAVEEASAAELREALAELDAGYAAAGRPLAVQEVAGGYRLVTRPEFDPWIARLVGRPGRARLSQPALETLAIVAYRQPVTRAALEEIRGVNAEGVLKTLIERDLVTVVGRDEGLGRPLLYGTTDAFLTYFGLREIGDLPRLEELEVFLSDREAEALGPDPEEAAGAGGEGTGATGAPPGPAGAREDVPGAAQAHPAPGAEATPPRRQPADATLDARAG